MPSKSTTIRVTNRTRDTVREISEITGMQQQEVVDEAVEAYRRHILLEKANQAYAATRTVRKEWEDELREREPWNATLADGAKES